MEYVLMGKALESLAGQPKALRDTHYTKAELIVTIRVKLWDKIPLTRKRCVRWHHWFFGIGLLIGQGDVDSEAPPGSRHPLPIEAIKFQSSPVKPVKALFVTSQGRRP